MRVAKCSLDVRVATRALPQGRDAAVVVVNIRYVRNVRNVRAVDDVHVRIASPVLSTVPGKEAVAGTARQPANTPEAAAEAKSNSYAQSSAAKTEEGNVSGRPNRTVVLIHRSRPPAPVSSIYEPAAVVIRRPTPRLGGNPGPTIVRLIHPATVAIGGPVSPSFGKPNAAVIRNIAPVAVSVKVVRAGIIRIGMAPACRALDYVVAVCVPLVPIVFIVCGGNIVLRVIRSALNGDPLISLDARAALRRGDFG